MQNIHALHNLSACMVEINRLLFFLTVWVQINKDHRNYRLPEEQLFSDHFKKEHIKILLDIRCKIYQKNRQIDK